LDFEKPIQELQELQNRRTNRYSSLAVGLFSSTPELLIRFPAEKLHRISDDSRKAELGMIGKFILSTLVGYYLLDSLAKLLNLRSLQMQVPKEFMDVYDANRYRRSQEYTRLNTWFELVVSTIELARLWIN
jgi:hypothetical protein